MARKQDTDNADVQPVENDATVEAAAPDEELAQASDMQTVAAAEAQEPLLDTSRPAASEEVPTGADADMVPAQTPEEVAAQVVNAAGEKLGFAEGHERIVPPTLDPSREAMKVAGEDTPAFLYPTKEERDAARAEARETW